MILEVFIVFILICFVLIFLGFYTQIKVTALIGFTGLFLLGMLLQAGHITAKSGYTETNTYVCTICGTPSYNVSSCTGEPTLCSFYNGNQLSCELYGCNYDNESALCTGAGYECSNYTDLTICGRAGCDVTTITYNGTVGINESALATTTSVYNYDSLTDNTSKWLGRWLAIVSILAFILVIISNKGAK